MRAIVSQHFRREGAADGGDADDRGRLERLAPPTGNRATGGVLVRVGQLVLGEIRRGSSTTRPLRIDQPAAPARLGLGSTPCGDHRRDDQVGDAGGGLARAEEQEASGRRASPPVMRSAESRPASATAAVPWMSSLKVQMRSRYLLQQPERVVVGEILELDQHAGKHLAAPR